MFRFDVVRRIHRRLSSQMMSNSPNVIADAPQPTTGVEITHRRVDCRVAGCSPLHHFAAMLLDQSVNGRPDIAELLTRARTIFMIAEIADDGGD